VCCRVRGVEKRRSAQTNWKMSWEVRLEDYRHLKRIIMRSKKGKNAYYYAEDLEKEPLVTQQSQVRSSGWGADRRQRPSQKISRSPKRREGEPVAMGGKKRADVSSESKEKRGKKRGRKEAIKKLAGGRKDPHVPGINVPRD